MNKNIKNLITILIISLFAFSIVSEAVVSNASAAQIPKSSNVALVPGPSGQAANGGSLPTSGWPNGDAFTFTNLSPDTIMTAATDPLTGFDTVVFVQLYISGDAGSSTNYWADSTFSSRISHFVSNGGKLIIYDSEITTNDYTNFIYPFNSSNPGQTGSEGQTWIVESDTLGSNSTTSSNYVNAPALCNSVAETGDSNVMTSFNQNWHVHMVCTNVDGVTGPVHTYAEFGKGLIIFNGEDMDEMSGTEVSNTDVNGIYGMIFYLELKQSFNPSSLPGTVGVSGIALTTATTTETVGNSHIVTVHMTDVVGSPVAGVTVSFKIDSGPNQGHTGTAVTNANGEATFSWQSTTAGTDAVTATAISPTDHTSTVTSSTNVTWVASQVTVTAAPVVTVTPTPTATPTPIPSPTPAPSIFSGSMLWIIIIIIIILVVIIIIVLLTRGRKSTNQTTVNVNYQAPPPPPPQ